VSKILKFVCDINLSKGRQWDSNYDLLAVTRQSQSENLSHVQDACFNADAS